MSKMGQHFLALQEAGIIPIEDFNYEDRGECGDASAGSKTAAGSNANRSKSFCSSQDYKGNQCGSSEGESLSSEESFNLLEDYYSAGWNPYFQDRGLG
jgi:hypothetical protein